MAAAGEPVATSVSISRTIGRPDRTPFETRVTRSTGRGSGARGWGAVTSEGHEHHVASLLLRSGRGGGGGCDVGGDAEWRHRIGGHPHPVDAAAPHLVRRGHRPRHGDRHVPSRLLRHLGAARRRRSVDDRADGSARSRRQRRSVRPRRVAAARRAGRRGHLLTARHRRLPHRGRRRTRRHLADVLDDRHDPAAGAQHDPADQLRRRRRPRHGAGHVPRIGERHLGGACRRRAST